MDAQFPTEGLYANGEIKYKALAGPVPVHQVRVRELEVTSASSHTSNESFFYQSEQSFDTIFKVTQPVIHFNSKSVDSTTAATSALSSSCSSNSAKTDKCERCDKVDAFPCSVAPGCLVRTHFALDLSEASNLSMKQQYLRVVENIGHYLQNLSDFDFDYFPKQATWRGKYVRGCLCTVVELHLFRDHQSTKLLVEANRLKGDNKPFVDFYREFKATLSNSRCPVSLNSQHNISLMSMPILEISDEQFTSSLKLVLDMAVSGLCESRLEASKLICKMATENHPALLNDDNRRCLLRSLESLLHDKYEDTKHFAIVALATLAELPPFQTDMLNSAVLPEIVAMVDNPTGFSFETIQVRRECARILALLTHLDGGVVADSLRANKVNVKAWLDRLVLLEDKRLKYHALKAKVSIEKSKRVASKDNGNNTSSMMSLMSHVY